MTFKLSKRSDDRLTGVHPYLRACVVLALREYSTCDFGVGKGATRTIEYQKRLVEEGSSRTLKSKHLPQKDGYSHAVDLYPSGYKTIEEIPDEAWQGVKLSMGIAASVLGITLTHGYDWGWDKPHHEIKEII